MSEMIEMVKYVSFDGKVFHRKDECVKHEKQLDDHQKALENFTQHGYSFCLAFSSIVDEIVLYDLFDKLFHPFSIVYGEVELKFSHVSQKTGMLYFRGKFTDSVSHKFTPKSFCEMVASNIILLG